MDRTKASARKRGRVRNRAVAPSDAIRRGEIVEEVVDNLRPWKNRKSRETVTRDVDHSIGVLRKLVAAQMLLLDQQPFREFRKKLDKALSDVEKVLASKPVMFSQFLFRTTPQVGDSFVSISSMSSREFEEFFNNHHKRSDAFDTELKRLRDICARDVGIHPNYDVAKHRSADFAHGLMGALSDQKISGTENKGFRVITTLLYEAISGEKNADLKRACDAAISGSYPYLANELGTNRS